MICFFIHLLLCWTKVISVRDAAFDGMLFGGFFELLIELAIFATHLC